MESLRTPSWSLLSAFAGLAAAAMIAACGSGSPTGSTPPTGSDSPATSSTLALSKCMRANGVPTFPDINAGTMRIRGTLRPNGQTVSVNGISVNPTAFQAARRACERYVPHITATPAQTAQFEKQALKFARCMRSHGIKNFPDLKPTVGPGGGQGVNLSGAGLDFQAPAFQAALNACGGIGALKGS